MLIPTIIMGAIAVALILVGYFRGNGQHITGLKAALGMSIEILPLLIFAFIVAGMVQVLIPNEIISGPVVMNLTSFLQNIKYIDDSSIKIYINYGLFANALDAKNQIESIFSLNTNKEIQNVLKQFLPKSLIVFMLKELGVDPIIKIHSLSRSARLNIIKSFPK